MSAILANLKGQYVKDFLTRQTQARWLLLRHWNMTPSKKALALKRLKKYQDEKNRKNPFVKAGSQFFVFASPCEMWKFVTTALPSWHTRPERLLYERWNDVKTLKQYRNNVVLTSCASWVSFQDCIIGMLA